MSTVLASCNGGYTWQANMLSRLHATSITVLSAIGIAKCGCGKRARIQSGSSLGIQLYQNSQTCLDKPTIIVDGTYIEVIPHNGTV